MILNEDYIKIISDILVAFYIKNIYNKIYPAIIYITVLNQTITNNKNERI